MSLLKVIEGDMVVYDTEDDDGEQGDALRSPIRLWIKNGTDVPVPYTIPDGLSQHQMYQISETLTKK